MELADEALGYEDQTELAWDLGVIGRKFALTSLFNTAASEETTSSYQPRDDARFNYFFHGSSFFF